MVNTTRESDFDFLDRWPLLDVTKFVSENFMSRMKNSFKNTKRPKVEKRNNDNEEPAAEEIAPTEEVYILLFSITCSRVLWTLLLPVTY